MVGTFLRHSVVSIYRASQPVTRRPGSISGSRIRRPHVCDEHAWPANPDPCLLLGRLTITEQRRHPAEAFSALVLITPRRAFVDTRLAVAGTRCTRNTRHCQHVSTTAVHGYIYQIAFVQCERTSFHYFVLYIDLTVGEHLQILGERLGGMCKSGICNIEPAAYLKRSSLGSKLLQSVYRNSCTAYRFVTNLETYGELLFYFSGSKIVQQRVFCKRSVQVQCISRGGSLRQHGLLVSM